MKEGYCRMTISSRKMSFQRMGFWGYYNHTIPLFSNKPSRPAPKFNVSNLAKVACSSAIHILERSFRWVRGP